MKRIIGSGAFLFALLFSGCLKDEVVRSYTFYRPVYKTTSQARAEIKSNDPVNLSQPGKIFYKDGYVFLNEQGRGVHIIDVRNPAQPKNISFVKIPGSVDLAVRGNILYADMYTDLVAIDISNPLDVKLRNTVEGVFPYNYYFGYGADSGKVVTDWIKVDTTIREKDFSSWSKSFSTGEVLLSANSSSRGGVSNGTGGSMARFALSGDRLYTVSHSDLNVFNTSVAENPAFIKKIQFSRGDIETIFPYANYLFMGSMTGMYIYDAADKDNPVEKTRFEHGRVCDPVICDGEYAYVTLRNGTQCGGFTNQLDVIAIKDISNPLLMKSYPMTNPHGLSKDGNILLICDGTDGLRLLDAGDPSDIKNLSQLKGFTSYDVIAVGGIALVSASDGLYLIDYSRPENPLITGSVKITN